MALKQSKIKSAQHLRHAGGPRIGNGDRERIITVYFQHGKEAADEIAVKEYKLSTGYVYKLMNARGLLPRRTVREDNI